MKNLSVLFALQNCEYSFKPPNILQEKLIKINKIIQIQSLSPIKSSKSPLEIEGLERKWV